MTLQISKSRQIHDQIIPNVEQVLPAELGYMQLSNEKEPKQVSDTFFLIRSSRTISAEYEPLEKPNWTTIEQSYHPPSVGILNESK